MSKKSNKSVEILKVTRWMLLKDIAAHRGWTMAKTIRNSKHLLVSDYQLPSLEDMESFARRMKSIAEDVYEVAEELHEQAEDLLAQLERPQDMDLSELDGVYEVNADLQNLIDQYHSLVCIVQPKRERLIKHVARIVGYDWLVEKWMGGK